MNDRTCRICGVVPRSAWLYGGTKFWTFIFGDRVCLTCGRWACAILGRNF